MGLLKKFNRGKKQIEAERKVKMDAFLKDMKEVALKHKMDIQPILAISETGIQPSLRIVDLPEQPKVIEVPK
jgi:hypothetical protein